MRTKITNTVILLGVILGGLGLALTRGFLLSQRGTQAPPLETSNPRAAFESPEAGGAEAEPTLIQEGKTPDGATLLDHYCSPCHLPKWIQQFKSSRPEWDEILDRMAEKGNPMSKRERMVLLDYLAADEQP